jgi:enamine deaminase RidA (YjgF/YER057c/UK114 family)
MVETGEVSPWTWQDNFGFAQSIEIKGAARTLVCAGQTSVDADGNVINEGDMAAQVAQAMDNLEAVLSKAGLKLGDVVRLNIFTTDIDAFLQNYGPAAERMAAAGCKPASTLLGDEHTTAPAVLDVRPEQAEELADQVLMPCIRSGNHVCLPADELPALAFGEVDVVLVRQFELGPGRHTTSIPLGGEGFSHRTTGRGRLTFTLVAR